MARMSEGDASTVALSGLVLPAWLGVQQVATSGTVDTFNFYADAGLSRLVAIVVATYTDTTKTVLTTCIRTL